MTTQEIDSFVKEIKDQISELQENDFKPVKVYLSEDTIDESEELLSEIEDLPVQYVESDWMENDDFVVAHEDDKEDSNLCLPTRERIEEEVKKKVSLDELDEEDYEDEDLSADEVDDDYGLLLELRGEVAEEGIEFDTEALEELNIGEEDMPEDKMTEPPEERRMMKALQFAVTGSKQSGESEEELEERLKDELTEEVFRTMLMGEYSYPMEYMKDKETGEPKRIGRGYFKFNRVLFPEEEEDESDDS